MLRIDQFAYSNSLRSVHPVEKVLFVLVTMGISLAANSIPVSLVIILLMAGGVIFKARIPCSFYFKLLAIPLSFLLVGTITIIISIARDSSGFLWYLQLGEFGLGLKAKDIIVALNIFLKSFAAITCLYFLALTTPMVEISSFLRRLKIPEIFIELMNLTYRFLFILLETGNQIRISQLSRSGYSSCKKTIFSLSRLVSSLFIRAIHRGRELFTALEARGYEGEIRVLEPEYRYSLKNIVIISLLDISLIILAVFT